MSILFSILIMLLILTVLVIVHEWGHYIAARIFKVKVNEFSIFMGPKIYSRVGKKTGTVFSIRCLPLGGFCAMEGEEKTEDGDGAFCNKPWWQRTIILLAGVFMNFMLAMIIITAIFVFSGYETRKVDYVWEHLPVSAIGLETGDKIINYNGYSIYNATDFQLVNYAEPSDENVITIKKANGKKEKYKFSRTVNEKEKNSEIKIYSVEKSKEKLIATYNAKWQNGKLEIDITSTEGTRKNYIFLEDESGYHSSIQEFDAQNNLISSSEPFNSETVKNELASFSPYKFGFNFLHEEGGFFGVIGNAFMYNVSLVKSVFNSLRWLITGKLGMDAMSGPIGLTTVVGDVVTAEVSVFYRVVALFEMGALISANLAAFNILPIPGLDGGKLIFVALELIRRGKKVPPEKEAVVSLIFLFLLIIFSIFIAGNDILRIIRS